MEDRIYCLVGPSGSGKTTVAKYLEDNGYNVVQSYTTRPPRSKHEWGHTFIESYPSEHVPKTIAYNEFNGFEYWAIDEQIQGKTIYIIDPPGDRMLRNLRKYPVTTIFLTVPHDIAYGRMETVRGHDKAIERIRHDKEVFKAVKTDWVLDADRDIRDILQDITEIMEG